MISLFHGVSGLRQDRPGINGAIGVALAVNDDVNRDAVGLPLCFELRVLVEGRGAGHAGVADVPAVKGEALLRRHGKRRDGGAGIDAAAHRVAGSPVRVIGHGHLRHLAGRIGDGGRKDGVSILVNGDGAIRRRGSPEVLARDLEARARQLCQVDIGKPAVDEVLVNCHLVGDLLGHDVAVAVLLVRNSSGHVRDLGGLAVLQRTRRVVRSCKRHLGGSHVARETLPL